MPVNGLKPLVQALLAQLPDDPTSIVISVKTETETPLPTNGQSVQSNGPVYDPSMVYLLELCTVLALRDDETIAALGADVAEALQNVLRNASSWHYIMISRNIYYLLNLLSASYVGYNVYLSPTMLIPSCRNIHLFVCRWCFTLYQVSRKFYLRNHTR